MKERITKLRQILLDQNLDAILVSQVSDIFYLTGYSNFSELERECFLVITANTLDLITDGRYIEAVKIHIPHFNNIEMRPNYRLVNVLSDLKKMRKISSIGIEENSLTVSEYKIVKKIFKRVFGTDLNNFRVIKDPSELKSILSACQLADKALNHVLTILKEGVTEIEVSKEFELYLKKTGGDLSFKTIVAFGENSAVPHHQSGEKKLKNGNLVLIDCGAKINGYSSDMTRTYVLGRASKKQQKLYTIVRNSQEYGLEYIQKCLKKLEKIKCSQLDTSVRGYIKKEGLSPFSHALGHGIGILVHEAPSVSSNSKSVLEEGMVFSIEPGVYEPGFGGVRIEDLFTIKNSKLIQLTRASKEFEIYG